jgi:hypothetical protein
MRFFTSLKMHNLRTFLFLVILLKVFVRGYRSIGGVESPGDARTHPIERAGGVWPSRQDERRRGDLA